MIRSVLPSLRRGLAAAALAHSLTGGEVSAGMASYYILRDGLSHFTSGVYAGYPNPNYGRLTFAYAHTYPTNPVNNHYHAKGRYQLSNAPPHVVTNINAHNYLPEGNLPPLRLRRGEGLYLDRLASLPYTDTQDNNYPFSKLEMRSVLDLTGFPPGSPEAFLYASSAGRWTNTLDGADLHLELVFLSPGLHIGTTNALAVGLAAAGDALHLGAGDQPISFTPVFWTDLHAAPGTYIARFKLTDANGMFEDSGPFEFRVEVPPRSIASYYVLADGLPVFTTGVYNGYANPNFGRLTFAYAHTYPTTWSNNHYHTKGRYQLSNAPPNVVTNINANNYLPEGAISPLQFVEGTGIFAGKNVIVPLADTNDPGYPFSLLEIRNVLDVSGYPPGSPEDVLYKSSARRWTNLLTGASIHLVLVAKSEGLRIGAPTTLSIGLDAPGDEAPIGAGHEFFSFTPVFWTEKNAPPGPHFARFLLRDSNGLFADSGLFEFRMNYAAPTLELAAPWDDPVAGIAHTSTSRFYQLWISTNLLDGGWVPHGAPVRGTGSNLLLTAPTHLPHVFMRYHITTNAP